MPDDLTVKRGIKKSLYLTALVVTIAVFAVGILVGFQLSSAVSNQFTHELEAIQTSSVNSELLSLLSTSDSAIKSKVCKSLSANLDAISLQTFELGQKLEVLEKKQGKDNPEVVFLKNQYFALEARDFLLFKKLREECNFNFKLILYFYGAATCSSKIPCEQAIKISEEQLEKLKSENKGNILIYSFDSDYEKQSPSIAALKSAYSEGIIPRVVEVR